MTARTSSVQALRAGNLTVDLTGVGWPDEPVEFRARVTHVDGSLLVAPCDRS